jgi:hypothetical protein
MKALIVTVLCLSAGTATLADPASTVEGDYVEVRSNHVYTCGCLYSGEAVTSGTEAILAWDFRKGALSDVELKNVRAAAVIVGPNNLSTQEGPRETALYLDGVRTKQQEQTLVTWFKQQYPDLLGNVVAVKRSPIHFDRTEEQLNVGVGTDVQLTLRSARIPEDAHLGSQQWYQPFTALKKTELSTVLYDEFTGDVFNKSWRRWEPRIAAFTGEFNSESPAR